MAGFCLLPSEVDKFKAKLIDGTIDPGKLADMKSSAERRAFFRDITGPENAKAVNALFESKLLLKNQQRGMITWAKKVSGITLAVRRDMISRIQRLDTVLNPADEKAFLADLAEAKLGVGVTPTEAKTIANLARKIDETSAKTSSQEAAMKAGFTPTEADMAHGYAQYDLQKYISDLKNNASKFKIGDLKTPLGFGRGMLELPKKVAEVSKSIGASLDDSFALRQGNKSLITHPTLWAKEFKQSFVNIAKGAKNAEATQREFRARLMADPMYNQAVKDGLALTKSEDVFPTSLPGKIPIAGRAFNASEIAYEAYAENLRLAEYKLLLQKAEKQGVDTRGVFGKNLATMVNSLTGRGGLGKLEPVSGPINLAFYSLRFLKSNVDTLLLHPLGAGVGGTMDLLLKKEGAQAASFAQKEAAKNLVKIIAATAGVLATADALKPGSVEWNPQSSDFGKIKVRDTRFDITGGMGSIVTLAARVASGATKSSVSGKITRLDTSKPFSPSYYTTILDFLTNKTSPIGGVLVDYAKNKTHQNTKPTIGGEIKGLVTPLGVSNFTELKGDPNSANILVAMIADGLGLSTNTYGKSTTDWNQSSTKELNAFKQQVGPTTFKQANQTYNKELDTVLQKLYSSQSYKNMGSDKKQGVVTSVKAKVKAQVLKKYGFTYKSSSKPSSNASILKSLGF